MEATISPVDKAKHHVREAISNAVKLVKDNRDWMSILRDELEADLDMVTAMAMGVKLDEVAKDKDTRPQLKPNGPTTPPIKGIYTDFRKSLDDLISDYIRVADANKDWQELLNVSLALGQLSKRLMRAASDMMLGDK